MILSSLLITSGCIFQPISVHEKEYNFVDMNAVVRLASPVKAELLAKDSKGNWVSIGRGEIPAGAYVRGQKPADIAQEVK